MLSFSDSERHCRTVRAIGAERLKKITESRVILFGLGGVGGHILETLARAGIGTLILVDCDELKESNLNRQLLATRATLGMRKVDAARARVAAIDPEIEVVTLDRFVSPENVGEILDAAGHCDFAADAIDNVAAKTALICACRERGIPVISSMGTGNKLDASRLRITDVTKTNTCPLARAMRLSLKKANVAHVPVLWSDEPPVGGTAHEDGHNAPGSFAPVPACAGVLIAGYILKAIAEGGQNDE